MSTIGLTGGAACGKSTVRELLAAHTGTQAFDADAFVHILLESNADVASRIRTAFGSEALGADGRPDRSALRNLVFRDPDTRKMLEGILHPLVRIEWQSRKEACIAAGENFLADIPLLYETEADKFFDAVIVVACSKSVQMERLIRRGLPENTARAMLASQQPIMQKVNRGSFVLWNDGSVVALRRQTELVAKQLFQP